jgi:hypothetical protein
MTALKVPTGASRLSFDAQRWTWLDAVAGAAAVILLFSLFDPWYDIRFLGCPGGACRGDNRLGKLTGITVHGYLWTTFAAALAILALLVLRALDRVAFFQSPNDRQLLAGLTGLNVSLVLLAFLDSPGFIAQREARVRGDHRGHRGARRPAFTAAELDSSVPAVFGSRRAARRSAGTGPAASWPP